MRARELLRRYGDLVLAVGLALLLLAELATWDGADTDVAVAGVAGAASALVLAFRRRSPLASYVACMAFMGIEQVAAPYFVHEAYAVLAIMLVNLYSLGAYARGTEAWLGVGGVLAGVVLLAISNDDLTSVGSLAFYCAFVGLPWGTGVIIRLRVERVTELQRHNAELRAQADRAVADERARIARELHDVVSHAIAVTVLQARGARRVLGHDEAALRRAFGAIEETNTAALADMRRLLALLREPDAESTARDDPAPSLERLDTLLDQVRSAGVPVELEVVGRSLPLSPGLDVSAFRVVQEALTNVLKHAGPGATARVVVTYDVDDMVVCVDDTGVGGGSGHGSGGQGLVGIRERASVLGGSVETGPTAQGFRVRARLPYLTEIAAVAQS